MKSVLQGISFLGGTSFLVKTSGQSTKKGLESIIGQVEHVITPINQLLNMAHCMPTQPQPPDRKNVVHAVLDLIKKQVRITNTDVESRWENDVQFFIRSNGSHLEQVLLNLCVDTIHAMPETRTLCQGLQVSEELVLTTIEHTGEDMP